jgi:hypothetical protein
MNVIYYILFTLFLIIYLISFKTVEGFDEFYGVTLPSSYVNDATPSKTINKFGFYKGKGTFKKGYTSQSKSDDKISTLNKLLNKLLGNLINDDQDCIGEFSKYSECDKSCGSNAYQTRTYNVKQKRGKNGKACPYDDGYEEKKICNLDYCQLGDICKENADCESGNCDPNSTRCENMVPCNKENVHVCNKNECMDLNDEYKDDPHMLDGSYLYNNVDEQCFFKSKTEIEKLNLDIYTYNFRDIKQKVEDYVLDCKYYQIKKDGDGPCVNSPNIIIRKGKPTCSPGFGPEPTPLNGSNACKDCIIKNDSGNGYLDNDNCFCPTGRRFKKETNTCSEEIAETDNLCKSPSDGLELIKFKDGSKCQYCPPDYSIKKDGNTLSCIKCGENELTISGYCRENCSGIDANTEMCNQYCELDDGGGYEINKDKLIFNVNGGQVKGLPGDSENYQEQCMAFAPANASCPRGSSREKGSCVCSGDNMKKNIIDDNTGSCINSCNPGYYYNSDTYECVVCDNQTGCKTPSDTANCILSADGTSKYKYCLEAENTGEDSGNNYYIDQGQVRTCSPNFWNSYSNTCSGGCHEGEYNAGDEDNIQCSPCPANTIGQSVTIDGVSACTSCGPGTESEPGSTICSPCDPGKYRSEDMVDTPCQPCPGGSYSRYQGSTECTPCPKGSYSESGSTHCLVKEDCWDKSNPSEFGDNLLESDSDYLVDDICGDPLCPNKSLCSSCDKYSRIDFGNPFVVYQTDDKPWFTSSCPNDVSSYTHFTDQGTLNKRCDNYYDPVDSTISDGGIRHNDEITVFNLWKQHNDGAVYSHKSHDNCKVAIPCYPVMGTGDRSQDLNIKRCYKFPTDDALSSSTFPRMMEIKSIKDLHKSGYQYNSVIYNTEQENR